MTPKNVLIEDIIASTEATARRLDPVSADKLRTHVSTVLRTSSTPKCNLPGKLLRAIKELRKDDSIVVLPADKGNATVVMNRSSYDEKIEQMLADSTYRKLKKDPTTKVEKEIGVALRQVEAKGEITKEKRMYLTPHSSSPPQLYGLPKIHKDGLPLRSIVSAIGSPTYKLSKELARVLSPLAGHTNSFVKNSSHFAQRIRETTLNTDDIMVSFDVVSLFTKVPVEEALNAISSRLQEDETLEERTSLSSGEVCKLTSLCLKSTYFQFKDSFYEQLEGVAMGSPLSLIVANLLMETFEDQALRSAALAPKMWLRYVDDTFVVWEHGQEALKEFHSHVNDQHTSIQFTIEEGAEGRIPFLDTSIERVGDQIQTCVFRKPMHTDRYVHFSSYHHSRILINTLCSLRDRAHNICSNSTNNELQHLSKVFEANGY